MNRKAGNIRYESRKGYLQGKDSLGNTFKIDEDMYQVVSKYKWYKEPNGYFKANIPDKTKKSGQSKLYLHRLVLEVEHGVIVDHIDMDKSNCQRANLRRATFNQNNAHIPKRSNTSSKYKGVCFDKSRNKWTANISIDRKNKHIGRYSTEEEAALAYNKKALEIHGEFAVLNIIE